MGRAIVREPQVFLMDEPLSNLDAKLRVQTRTQIASLQRRLGITTVYVTHDQVEAMTMGDRVAVLKDGLLQQVDTPRNMYDRPANLFVAGFIGSPAMNLVEVPITDGGVKFGNSVVPVEREALSAAADKGDTTVTVGVRPEHFDVVERRRRGQQRRSPRTQPAGLAVTVNVVEELGADGYVYGTAKVGGEERTWWSASAAARCRRRAPSCTSCRAAARPTSSPPPPASASATERPHDAAPEFATARLQGPYVRATNSGTYGPISILAPSTRRSRTAQFAVARHE